MPALDQEDELSSSRQVVLILRLVLDRRGQLHHGELVDAEAIPQARFVSLSGLTDALNRWLERQYRAGAADADQTE